MIKERELLRRAYELLDRRGKIENFDKRQQLLFEIYTYLSTPSDDAEEPVAWMFQHEDTGLIDYVDTQQVEWGFEKNNPRWQKIGPVFLHPPRPEPDAEPVAWGHPNTAITGKSHPLMMVNLEIPSNAQYPQLWVPLYLHPPKPAESEAETIETLQAENFKLASGQCTEGGPWGDEGGTPYCKYAEPAARKPMTEEEIDEAIATNEHYCERSFAEGVRYAEKYHGITDADV